MNCSRPVVTVCLGVVTRIAATRNPTHARGILENAAAGIGSKGGLGAQRAIQNTTPLLVETMTRFGYDTP